MRMLRSVLLLALAVLMAPVLAQADCASICESERQSCMASQCPTQFYCEECEAVYSSCMTSCQNPGGGGCIPSGSIDDTLGVTHCCSGQAVPGSTYCINPADYGTTWASCSHICA